MRNELLHPEHQGAPYETHIINNAKRTLQMVWSLWGERFEEELHRAQNEGGHPSLVSFLFGEISTQLLSRRQNNLRHGVVRRLRHAQQNLKPMLVTAIPLYTDEK